VEVLAAYSHSPQPADLQASIERVSAEQQQLAHQSQAWSLADRLSPAQRAAIVEAYQAGATAASLATSHALSLSSVKRLIRSANLLRRM
jgi:DNA-directed RNA polymerase specialized sigma24 family protein